MVLNNTIFAITQYILQTLVSIYQVDNAYCMPMAQVAAGYYQLAWSCGIAI